MLPSRDVELMLRPQLLDASPPEATVANQPPFGSDVAGGSLGTMGTGKKWETMECEP